MIKIQMWPETMRSLCRQMERQKASGEQVLQLGALAMDNGEVLLRLAVLQAHGRVRQVAEGGGEEEEEEPPLVVLPAAGVLHRPAGHRMGGMSNVVEFFTSPICRVCAFTCCVH